MKSKTTKAGARATASRQAAYRRKPVRTKAQRAGRPTLEELERRKAKVMQVATALFVEHGYAATSLVDIAKAAGVATRTLYQHFGDKEAIFLEVVTARESGAVFEASLGETESLFDGVMQIARYICEVSLRPRSVELNRLAIAESRRFPEFMLNLTQKAFSRFRANVASMFEELAARKLAPPSDSAKTAALFTDLILGSTPLLVYAGWSSSRPAEAELEAKVELFIEGRFGAAVAKRARTPKLTKAKRAGAPKAATAVAPAEKAAGASKRPRASKAAA